MARERIGVDAHCGEESPATRGQPQAVAAGAEQPPLLQSVENEHAELARQVVVADACLAQRRLARTRANARRAGPVGDAHETLEQVRDVAAAQPEVTVPALALHGHEPRVQQLGEMAAHRLLGDARHARKLGRGQGFAGSERGQDFRARVIADQRRDADDAGAVLHGSIVAEPFMWRKLLSLRSSHFPIARRHDRYLLHPL